MCALQTLSHSQLCAAGFADPVYAEAYVTVHQYDIVLDVTVINRTRDTLQNLCLEQAAYALCRRCLTLSSALQALQTRCTQKPTSRCTSTTLCWT